MSDHRPAIPATVFINGRFFSPDAENGFASAMVVSGDKIVYVGSEDHECVRQARASGRLLDLGNKLVLPGFIDGHVHILNFGLSLQKLDLLPCKSLQDIRQQIKSYAGKNPVEPRILCRGWLQSVTEGQAAATALDDLDPRPIYVEALDLHSTWCNTAALHELGVEHMANPPGGTIYRAKDGRPSGLLDEAAHFNVVWPFLDRVASLDKKLAAIDAAFTAHRRAGYTGLVDMAMDEKTWETIKIYRQRHGGLPLHVAVHWLIPYSHDQGEIGRQIDRAIELHKEFNSRVSPEFCINGIKLICDGTVDGCTASLLQPYAGLAHLIDPIWPAPVLLWAIRRATDAGLQCALHAIGDRSVQEAIDCLSQVPRLRECRHRIEHLELTTPEDAKKLGDLGIIASVQPVHLDPATFGVWPEFLGPERCCRAFAYREFADGGACLAFGTDAPTAKHLPLPNLYNATTRRSALEPSMSEVINPDFALPLATAVAAATSGAAFAAFVDSWTGSLLPGLQANFVILDMDWTPERLLQALVREIWYKGKRVVNILEMNPA